MKGCPGCFILAGLVSEIHHYRDHIYHFFILPTALLSSSTCLHLSLIWYMMDRRMILNWAELKSLHLSCPDIQDETSQNKGHIQHTPCNLEMFHISNKINPANSRLPGCKLKGCYLLSSVLRQTQNTTSS